MSRALDQKPNEISRRAALAGLAAATASPLLLGWPDTTAADDSHDKTASAHRLHFVATDDKGLERLRQQFGGESSWTTCGGKAGMALLTWITPTQAAALRNDKNVQAVRPFTAADIVQIGDAKHSDGKVCVQVAPGDWQNRPTAGTYRTRRQLVAEWTKTLAAVPAVKVELLPLESDEGQAAADADSLVPGQIQISYSSDECPEEVLKLIRSDPQVHCIQWGGPRRVDKCPFCGLG